ncbi:hypothetical protein Q31b_01480 [Novipirellula aureliae]|uniref:Uncharacterized protein n=1 Tax=Novipirellula aureliae TaxID=2527966 RepID=A0A5C6EAH6_9BACT|nr:hypothetical protein [Novipirellula aureliae]TWU44977.1 hypothetical protein Q31b_01480 [Novipirellula aureliae]
MGAVLGRLSTGWGLLMQTLPILMVRLGIYAAFAIGIAIYLLIFSGLAWLFGRFGWVVMLFAIIGLGGIWVWVRRYLLYMVQAAHVAVMTELIVHKELPKGVNQYQYGKEIITNNVKDISILFAVDALVDGTLKAFTRKVANIVDFLPLPGIEKLAKAAMAIVDRSLTYVDEAIFSYWLTRRDQQTLWASAKDGVILYAQSWKELLKVAVGIWLIGVLSFFVLLVLFLVPGLAVGYFFESLKLPAAIFVVVSAYVINLALYEPLGLAAMIATYHEETKDMTPDPVWDERLTAASTKFTELKDRAVESMAEWTDRGSTDQSSK